MKRALKQRLMNYGTGDLFNFHGAYTELKAALAKEKQVPGAFIKDVYFRGGPRFGVLTRNPKTRKRNVEWGTYEKGVFHPWTRRPKTRKKKAVRRLKRNISPVLGLEALSDLKSLGFFGSKRKKSKRRNATDTKLVQKALEKLFPGKSAWQLTPAQLSQVLRYAQDLKAGKANPPRRGNPSKRNYADATELYTQFHGRGPRRVTDTGLSVADYDNHPELAQLGKLESLTIGGKGWRKKIEWGSREAPDLAAEPGGKQLYIVGGSQNLDDGIQSLPIKLNGGRRVKLGEAYQIEYHTQKGFDGFQPVTYFHHLGEDTGVRPRVVYDRAKKLIYIVGGAYTVKDVGIVN
jgi:hypothetical protein